MSKKKTRLNPRAPGASELALSPCSHYTDTELKDAIELARWRQKIAVAEGCGETRRLSNSWLSLLAFEASRRIRKRN